MVTTRDAQQLFDALDFPSPDSVTERAVEWMRDNLDPATCSVTRSCATGRWRMDLWKRSRPAADRESDAF